MANDFADIAEFVTTYISEAHPDGNDYNIRQHASIKKILAASILLENKDLRPQGTCLIDTMESNAERLYGALPERLYIVLDGVIVYAGGRGPFGYKVDEVKDWLKKFKAKLK